MNAQPHACPAPDARWTDGPASLPERAHGLYFAGVIPFPRAARELLEMPIAPRPLVPRPGAGREYAFLANLLDRAGLRIECYRPGALLRRIPACLRFLGVSTVPEASRRLLMRPVLFEQLLDIVLLGVTEFRRDPAVFQYLQATLLPELAQAHACPRIWSAACSEGQELYSVAASLAELHVLESCELLGTDCRPEAIARARSGEYAPEAARMLPPDWRRSHLLSLSGRARIHPRLRVAPTWRVSDLLTGVEAGPWHLILCRNAAIYFEPAVVTDLWRRLAGQLAPGGYLVTGKAENPAIHPAFERVASCVFRRRKVSP